MGCIESLMKFCGPDSKKSVSDISLICDNIKLGRLVTNKIKNIHKINFQDTYAENEKKLRLQKNYFYKGREMMKATTIHSFKGWESSLIILYVDNLAHYSNRILFYTGITRLKRTNEGSFLYIVSPDESPESVMLAEYINSNFSL